MIICKINDRFPQIVFSQIIKLNQKNHAIKTEK